MKRIAAFCLALTLAACGVDGTPITPDGDEIVTSGAMPSVSYSN